MTDLARTTSGYSNTFRLLLHTEDKGDRFITIYQGSIILTGRYDYENYNGFVKLNISVYMEFYKRNSYITNHTKVPVMIVEDNRETKQIWAYRMYYSGELNSFVIDFTMNGRATKTRCGIIVDDHYTYGAPEGGVKITLANGVDPSDSRFTVI